MKRYEVPEIEIVEIKVEDIVTTSFTTPENPEGGLGWG